MYKKFTLVFFSMIMCSLTFAQIGFGIKAGITESFLRHEKENYGLKAGLQIGAFADIPLKKSFNLRPALQFTQKGFKEIVGKTGVPFYWNRNFSSSYLELPIDVVYDLKINQYSSLQIGTGPVLSYALFGKNKTIITFSDTANQPKTEYWVNDRTFESRIDFGWNFLVAIKYYRAMISANYNCGLANLTGFSNHQDRNRSFALTVGYRLTK